jgi:phenylacetate-CoA ligase
MLTQAIELFEGVALRTNPERAIRLLGSLPASMIDAMRRARFRRTMLRAANHSSFYRDQFRKRGIDPRRIGHPSELGDFYTTGDDLRAFGAEQFLTGHADTAFETTGTTSPLPKTIFFSREELATMGRITAIWLYLLGLRRDDRILSAFDCSFWVSPAVLRAGLEYLKCFHVEAGKIDPQLFYERARTYRPTVIFGEPSWMIRLSEIAERYGVWPVKFLWAGGENLSESGRISVEQVWSAPLYLNYGQTESFGALGAECKLKKGYHRNDLYFFFELDNVDAEGYGEVIYTTLARDVMPLIRYRSNDVARLIEEPCECGVFAGRMGKVRARCDEMVVCGMGNVGPWVFDEVLRDISGISSEWQVFIKHESYCDAVELHVETLNGSALPQFRDAVLLNLRNRFPDFWKNHEMRLYELRVIPCTHGTLRNGRKLQRVIDQRDMSR